MQEILDSAVKAVELILTLNPEVMEIARRSLAISLASTVLAAAISIPLGGLIHFHNFFGKRSVINLLQTLYSLPTVLVGLFVFLLLSRVGPLGFLHLLFTPGGMVLGQAILITPIIIGLTISALSGISPQIRDTCISLGATRTQVLITILLEARAAVVAAVLLGFGRAISEVGVAMMIGGNIRGYTRVLTTAIALQTSMGELELSIALGFILLGISLVVNLVLNRLQGDWWS